MDGSNEESDEAKEEIMPLGQRDSRRQRKQLRFLEVEENEEEKQSKSPTSFKPPGRASRFLSICEPSLELPGASLSRLRQLHSQSINDRDSSVSEEIPDEVFDKIPFKIAIIPERRDDFDIVESPQKKKEPAEIPSVIPSGLSRERRLQIIEKILKDLSQINLLDEIRRTNAIPFQLPRNNQMQKNVAERIRDLTGSEIIILNDPIYMKNLCQRLEEKHKEKLEENFQRLASNEKRRQLFENSN